MYFFVFAWHIKIMSYARKIFPNHFKSYNTYNNKGPRINPCGTQHLLIVVLQRHNSVITHSYDSLSSCFPFDNLLISRFQGEKKRVEESFIYRLEYMFLNILYIVYC